jgi:hypothetical protein
MLITNDWHVVAVTLLGLLLIAVVFGIPIIYTTERDLKQTQARLQNIRMHRSQGSIVRASGRVYQDKNSRA